MRKAITVAALGILALLIVPVVITQFAEPERRRLDSVKLEDTSFREISFRNAAQDLTLAGLLFEPVGEGPFPAAVIIHGSGTSRRDNGWYLTLTRYLQENGVAVLLPDKRGSEQSEGDWRTASFADLATDTLAAIDCLQREQPLAISGIGIIGMSQGGNLAPVVADQAPELAFVVNIVGGAVTMHEQLVYEENHNIRQLGVLPGFSDVLAYPAAWSIIKLRQKEFWSAVGNFDPLPYWQRLAVPSLVLYGQDDTNVPSDESAARLRSLQNPHIEVKIFAGSGHALEDPVGHGNSIIREEVLSEVRRFIAEASGTP